MRRRQNSPWLIAEKNRIRTEAPQGVTERVREGENPFQVWREENATTLRKLARLSGIDSYRLLAFEGGQTLPHADELEALAKALRVTADLLTSQIPGPAAGSADGAEAGISADASASAAAHT